MKIEVKQGPAIPFVDKPGGQSNLAKENRARAIEAFNKASQAAPAPSQAPQNSVQQGTTVQNASNVSPEEMAGLRSSQAPQNETQENLVNSPNDTVEEATTPAKTSEEPLSPHYALLARKERALRAQVQKFNAERAAFKAEQEARTQVADAPKAPAFDESKYITRDRVTSDTLGVLEELGLSREELAQKLLNADQISPAQASYMRKLEEKIAKLEAKQEESAKTFEDSQNDSYNQAITAMEYEAEDLVNTDPEFATIKETGQHKEIVNLIKDVHAKGLPGRYKKGTLLSVDQAARLVEDELVNQWTEQYEKLSRIEKIQKRIKPAPSPSAKQSQASQGTQAQNSPATTKTLTNSMGSAGKLSARERAIAVFNGNKS